MTGESRILKLVVIGLGHQSVDDHIPAIRDSDLVQLVGVVDVDAARAAAIGQAEGVPHAAEVSALLDNLPEQPDAALIAVPHSGYLAIMQAVAERGIHIIKEKPFAVSSEDAKVIQKLVADCDITLQVTLQRRFNPIFRSFEQLKKRIGRIYSIEARYTLNVARLDEGWRASRLFSGGGALIDLGYHYIDLLVWYFGLPQRVTCDLSSGNRPGQLYDVEDTAMLHFAYGDEGSPEATLGSLIVSRVYPDKDESLVAYGTHGSVAVQRGRVSRRDISGNVLECLERTGSWPSALIDQLEDFAENVLSRRNCGTVERRYLEQAALAEAAYRSARSRSAINPREVLNEILAEGRGA